MKSVSNYSLISSNACTSEVTLRVTVTGRENKVNVQV